MDVIPSEKETPKTYDSWTVLQNMPELFSKGGQYYQQVMKLKGTKQPKEAMHVQFPEIPNKVFALSLQREALEVCLGDHHVPVGPLTPEEEALATAASVAAAVEGGPEGGGESTKLGMGGVINKPQQQGVKAFSGRGHSLSGNSGHASFGSSSGMTGEQQVGVAKDGFMGCLSVVYGLWG